MTRICADEMENYRSTADKQCAGLFVSAGALLYLEARAIRLLSTDPVMHNGRMSHSFEFASRLSLVDVSARALIILADIIAGRHQCCSHKQHSKSCGDAMSMALEPR
jgi:hypothetical protein